MKMNPWIRASLGALCVIGFWLTFGAGRFSPFAIWLNKLYGIPLEEFDGNFDLIGNP
jgi:hypothetical protein